MSLHKQISLLPKDIISKIILYYGCINKIDHSLKKSIKVYSALLLANYYMMRTFSGLRHNISDDEIHRMYLILRNCGCCERHLNYFESFRYNSNSNNRICWRAKSSPSDKDRYCKWHFYNSKKINRRIYNNEDDCVLETYCNCHCRHISRFLVRHNHISLIKEASNLDINFNKI